MHQQIFVLVSLIFKLTGDTEAERDNNRFHVSQHKKQERRNRHELLFGKRKPNISFFFFYLFVISISNTNIILT